MSLLSFRLIQTVFTPHCGPIKFVKADTVLKFPRSARGPNLRGSRLDADIDASRKAELVERVDRLGGSLNEVDDSLMGPNFELLTSFLVNVRAGKNGVLLDSSRERNRSSDNRAGSLGSIHDFHSALIKSRVIVRFHSNSDNVLGGRHFKSPFFQPG